MSGAALDQRMGSTPWRWAPGEEIRVFGFGKRQRSTENSFRDPVVQTLSEMIGVFEDQVSQLRHLSLPNTDFSPDVWPPPGAQERHDRTASTLGNLRQQLAEYLAGDASPQDSTDTAAEAGRYAASSERWIDEARAHLSTAAHQKSPKGHERAN